jgi:hypothetical protein
MAASPEPHLSTICKYLNYRRTPELQNPARQLHCPWSLANVGHAGHRQRDERTDAMDLRFLLIVPPVLAVIMMMVV